MASPNVDYCARWPSAKHCIGLRGLSRMDFSPDDIEAKSVAKAWPCMYESRFMVPEPLVIQEPSPPTPLTKNQKKRNKKKEKQKKQKEAVGNNMNVSAFEEEPSDDLLYNIKEQARDDGDAVRKKKQLDEEESSGVSLMDLLDDEDVAQLIKVANEASEKKDVVDKTAETETEQDGEDGEDQVIVPQESVADDIVAKEDKKENKEEEEEKDEKDIKEAKEKDIVERNNNNNHHHSVHPKQINNGVTVKKQHFADKQYIYRKKPQKEIISLDEDESDNQSSADNDDDDNDDDIISMLTTWKKQPKNKIKARIQTQKSTVQQPVNKPVIKPLIVQKYDNTCWWYQTPRGCTRTDCRYSHGEQDNVVTKHTTSPPAISKSTTSTPPTKQPGSALLVELNSPPKLADFPALLAENKTTITPKGETGSVPQLPLTSPPPLVPPLAITAGGAQAIPVTPVQSVSTPLVKDTIISSGTKTGTRTRRRRGKTSTTATPPPPPRAEQADQTPPKKDITHLESAISPNPSGLSMSAGLHSVPSSHAVSSALSALSPEFVPLVASDVVDNGCIHNTKSAPRLYQHPVPIQFHVSLTEHYWDNRSKYNFALPDQFQIPPMFPSHPYYNDKSVPFFAFHPRTFVIPIIDMHG